MPVNTVYDPTDKGTLRPNDAPIHQAGKAFIPLSVEYRPTQITLPEGVDPLKPITLFLLYYNKEIIQSIVDATNAYQRKVGDAARPRGGDWWDTNPQEIYLYTALRVYMTLHVENEIVTYWETSKLGAIHTIMESLPVDRFQELHIRFRLGLDASTPYTRVYSPLPA